MRIVKYENNVQFNNCILELENDLVCNSIDFYEWKDLVNKYKKYKHNYVVNASILNRMGLCLYNSNVIIYNKSDKVLYKELSNELYSSFIKTNNKDDLYINMILSRVRALGRFFSMNNSIEIGEWLWLYNQFTSAYLKLIEIRSKKSHLIIKLYAETLYKAKIKNNYLSKSDDFRDKMDELKLAYTLD